MVERSSPSSPAKWHSMVMRPSVFSIATVEELNALLNLDKREPEVVDAEPDENQRPPARPAAQMER